VIRRFNYTGRRKITRSRVQIVVHDDPGQRTFDAHLKLTGLDLPPEAAVFVEAYHRAAYRRWDFGTVVHLTPPPDRTLDGIPTASPLFRVKVVQRHEETGRILAAAERIVPVRADQADQERQSLLPVEYQDLGERIWALDLDGDWPRLILNQRYEGLRDLARSGPEFLALVYPEVLRAVLARILEDPDLDPDGEDDDWPTLWVRFVTGELGCGPPPGSSLEGEAREPDPTGWIDEAVTRFCVRMQVGREFARHLAGREG
jgi:hypothetical protein